MAKVRYLVILACRQEDVPFEPPCTPMHPCVDFILSSPEALLGTFSEGGALGGETSHLCTRGWRKRPGVLVVTRVDASCTLLNPNATL